jgi:GGDEF domain-containing protein
MTTIVGTYLILLNVGAFLMVLKVLYFRSVYDTWAHGSGDILLLV